MRALAGRHGRRKAQEKARFHFRRRRGILKAAAGLCQVGGRVTTKPAGSEVKKLIRNKATRAFLAADGTWTEDVGAGRDFPRTEEVSRVLMALEGNLELYFCFGENRPTEWDFALPLR